MVNLYHELLFFFLHEFLYLLTVAVLWICITPPPVVLPSTVHVVHCGFIVVGHVST